MYEYFAQLNYNGQKGAPPKVMPVFGIHNVEKYVDEVWKYYGRDRKDGQISFEEGSLVFKDLLRHKPDFGFKKGQEKQWFSVVDADGDGQVNRLEMMTYLNNLRTIAAKKPLMNVVKDKVTAANAFKHASSESIHKPIQSFVDHLWDVYDADKDGFITIEESEGFFAEIINNRPDLGFTSGMLRQWFNSIDVDGDKVITKHEMLHYFTSINYNG
jgi:Ca2+-binding EF-hand superfamily protein